MTIALTGYMGCGKSTVGRKLSARLGMPFIDLDAWIVDHQGRSIKDIFASDGEEAFRRIETDALRTVLTSHDGDLVLSLGGGTPMRPENAALLREYATTFYLRACLETILKHLEHGRDSRPMLQGNDIGALLEKRAPVYESVADYILDIDGLNPPAVVRDICVIIGK